MWNTKFFSTYAEQIAWINRNKNDYQIDILIVANGYAVEYKKLRKIYFED